MELAQPACLGLGRLARMEQRVRAARDPKLEVECAVQRLQHTLHDLISAHDDAGDTPMLVRELLARREVDPRDLEQRDVIRAGIDARPRRFDQARHDGRPEDRLVRRHRAGEANRVRVRIRRDEAPRVRLGEPRADEGVLDDPAQTLILREPSADVTSQRHRERDAIEERSRDLLDEVHLAADVARPPRGHGDVPLVGDVEAQPPERRPLVGGRDLEPDQARRPLGPEADDRPCREPVLDVEVPRHPRAGQVDEQTARENGRVLGEMRVDALLPAVRAGRAQREPLGRALDAERLEVRRLEEHLGRRVGDLAVLATHDRGQRDGALAVRDQQVGSLETPERPVERAELLAGAGMPHDDPPVGELRAVERVQGASPHMHDVVRDVHDVRDGAHLGEEEPRPKPLRRRTDRDVAEETADVARAPIEVLDHDVDVLGVDDGGIERLRRMQLASEECRDLAREPDHREQVDPIHRGRDVEHLVADREHVHEWRSGLGTVGEHHDPGVVVAEPDLVLGEDHPAGGLATELALVERLVEDRQECTGQRDRDGRAGLEVPRATHDLSRTPLPYVHVADAEPIGVRMRIDLEHAPDEETAEIAVDVRHADVDHALHLER